MEEAVGIHTLSEKRTAKLNIMAPYLTEQVAIAEDGSMAIKDLSTEVYISLREGTRMQLRVNVAIVYLLSF